MDHRERVQQDETTSEAARSKLSLTLEAIESPRPASTGAPPASDTVDGPYTHIQRALALFDPSNPAKQNARRAEAEWKQAIASADKLPVAEYAAKLSEVEARIKTESDPLASQELLDLKEGLRELIALPVKLRLATATFYLQNSKLDDAKAMLALTLEKNPALKDQEQFKQLLENSREHSKGTLGKTISFLEFTAKDLLSDGIAGSVGLARQSVETRISAAGRWRNQTWAGHGRRRRRSRQPA